jgi:hypothetical protein
MAHCLEAAQIFHYWLQNESWPLSRGAGNVEEKLFRETEALSEFEWSADSDTHKRVSSVWYKHFTRNATVTKLCNTQQICSRSC